MPPIYETDAQNIKLLVHKAVSRSRGEPADIRIRIHEAAAVILENIDPRAAEVSAETCALLRQADRCQLNFEVLISK